MNITGSIFRAYLKCPMKSWLRATGEPGTGNTYAEWLQTQEERYRLAAANRLLSGMRVGEDVLLPLDNRSDEGHFFAPGDLKAIKWRLAFDVTLSTKNETPRGRNDRGRVINHSTDTGEHDGVTAIITNRETNRYHAPIASYRFHGIERLPSEGPRKPIKFAPIRFALKNELDNEERMMLAFDGLVLSEILNRPVVEGKIIHGDKHTTLRLNISSMVGQVRTTVDKIIKLVSCHSPPELLLIRHCTECEFQAHCRKIAIEKDELSLLSNMTTKQREKLRAKGIFTLNQLSYTFRPRRRGKKRNEKYHHSLKALAIREHKIHFVGVPDLKIAGTPVYLDVEGLPDRSSYYLIGARIGYEKSVIQHSLWADETDDEQKIWNDFLGVLAGVKDPVLIHYGSYEKTFLARMRNRYSIPPQFSSLGAVFECTINLLSIIFAKIYYPTYSNGLKDIARSLDFRWSDQQASGLNSMMWRQEWEETRSDDLAKRNSLFTTRRIAQPSKRLLMRLRCCKR